MCVYVYVYVYVCVHTQTHTHTHTETTVSGTYVAGLDHLRGHLSRTWRQENERNAPNSCLTP
jgi:hypothetical protein